jgi:hypothetical protein
MQLPAGPINLTSFTNSFPQLNQRPAIFIHTPFVEAALSTHQGGWMEMKRTLILSLGISLLFSLGELIGVEGVQSSDAKARALELIAQARAAIGGEEKLRALKSLSAEGTFRRIFGERQMDGEVEIGILFPDRFRRDETMSPMPSMQMTRTESINGDQVWTDSQSSGTGGMVLIRRPGGDGPQAAAAQEQAIRAEFARLLLGFLLTTSSSFPLDFKFAGEAEASDGRADAIDVTGPNNFAARLFLDQKTHRPLMLTYRGRPPRIQMRTMSGPPASREELEKRAREAEEQAAGAPEVEYQLRYDDYRPVDGLVLPHSISRAIDGAANEELALSKIKLNPTIKPEKFEKK